MDWVYGYLTSARHHAMLESAKLRWEVGDYIAILAFLATTCLGIATYFVAREAGKAAKNAAIAADAANQQAEKNDLNNKRSRAMDMAASLLTDCLSINKDHIKDDYELWALIGKAAVKNKDDVVFVGTTSLKSSEIIKEAANHLKNADESLKIGRDLIPRARDILLEAESIISVAEYDRCLNRIVVAKLERSSIGISISTSHIHALKILSMFA